MQSSAISRAAATAGDGPGARGTDRVDASFRPLAGAINLARLAVLGLRGTTRGWAVAA